MSQPANVDMPATKVYGANNVSTKPELKNALEAFFAPIIAVMLPNAR